MLDVSQCAASELTLSLAKGARVKYIAFTNTGFGNSITKNGECNLLSMIFYICIDDIFKRIARVVVHVSQDKIPGLLFADDAVILAESADELQKASERKKSGIMTINCSTDTTFKIQNQLISAVKEYKYLIIEFNDKWNNKYSEKKRHTNQIQNNGYRGNNSSSSCIWWQDVWNFNNKI
ncbi:hypothetical protein BB561_005798 [Smittium simulii]|uniref:Reverse transcriptase domain-containing protein n=1 Tax=Smittium simulii TaxID=133385 RepID=A0A2T9Y860_9FUNG|nr:hypothetical protein BB561_005798 [Smittium simulii]